MNSNDMVRPADPVFNDHVNIATQALGGALPTDAAALAHRIAESGMADAAIRATLDFLADPSAAEKLLAKLESDGTQQSSAALHALRRGSTNTTIPGVGQYRVPSTGETIAARVRMIIGAEPPSDVRALSANFEKKDDQAKLVWKTDPRVMQGLELAAYWLRKPDEHAELARAANQSLDLSVFKQVLADDGLLGAPVDRDMSAILEVAVWMLDTVYECSHPSTVRHQDAAARHVLERGEHLTSFTNEDKELLAGLLSATGNGGVKVEEFVTNPANAKARLQELTGGRFDWLQTPSQFRAMGDAVLLLKLADQNRGKAFQAFEAAGPGVTPHEALKDHAVYRGKTVQFYRDAVRERQGT